MKRKFGTYFNKYIRGLYSEEDARQIFDRVFNEKVKNFLGSLNYNDMMFEYLYQKSITKTRSLDTTMFVAIMCGLLTLIGSLISINLTLKSFVIEHPRIFEINIEALGDVQLVILGSVFVAIMIVFWHPYATRKNQEREYKDLLRETIQCYLNDKTISRYFRKKLNDEWNKIKI